MRRDDSVFLFTLVDFFVTALFFGLVLFALDHAKTKKLQLDKVELTTAVDTLTRAAGVSSLRELTDRLTRLGPVKDAQAAVQTVKAAGGVSKIGEALTTLAAAGGTDSVAARLERLRQHEEGVGLPHCLVSDTNSKQAKLLAKAIASDSTVSFVRNTPQLGDALALVNVEFQQVAVMSLPEFHRLFSRLATARPKCLYTIEFEEHTRYTEPRDAVKHLVYLRTHR